MPTLREMAGQDSVREWHVVTWCQRGRGREVARASAKRGYAKPAPSRLRAMQRLRARQAAGRNNKAKEEAGCTF